jgi:hypothetical protein
MNLPDIHTQKLLDCLTHSRLGFALYRLPWTDECYLVLQTSGDVEQLAEREKLFVQTPEAFGKRFNIDVRTRSEVEGRNRIPRCSAIEFE